jgi:hypothetical protein
MSHTAKCGGRIDVPKLIHRSELLTAYAAVFGDIDNTQYLHWAATRQLGVPFDLIYLLRHALTHADDRAVLGALRDRIEEYQGRPESVTVNGESIPLDRLLSYQWWEAVFDRVTVRAVIRHIGDDFEWAFSIGQLAGLDVYALREEPTLGPKRLAKIRTWLAGLGLRLSDDPAPEPGQAAVQPHPEEPALA